MVGYWLNVYAIVAKKQLKKVIIWLGKQKIIHIMI